VNKWFWAAWLPKKIKGTEVDLEKLKSNQRVGWGDGKTYHIRYTFVYGFLPVPARGEE